LQDIASKSSNAAKGPGWDVPSCRPPNRDDPTAIRIALKFFHKSAHQKGFI
jgi:hypothetical protein